MAHFIQHHSKWRVHGCDIFLLDNWNADAVVSPDAQAAQLFQRFLDLPFAERHAYTQQVKARNVYRTDRLSQSEQDVLSFARPDSERNLGDVVMLRTYYGVGSDDSLAGIVAACSGHLPELGTSSPGPQYLLSDASRYDYGNDWRRIFRRIPQLLEYGGSDDYDKRVASRLAEAQEWEREDKEAVEEEGYQWPEDGTYLGDLYNYYHLASKVGIVYILDEETLGRDENNRNISHDARQMLAVWYDVNGKTVRWRRMSPGVFCEHMGIIESAAIDDSPIWTRAEIGEDYQWENEDSTSGSSGSEDAQG